MRTSQNLLVFTVLGILMLVQVGVAFSQETSADVEAQLIARSPWSGNVSLGTRPAITVTFKRDKEKLMAETDVRGAGAGFFEVRAEVAGNRVTFSRTGAKYDLRLEGDMLQGLVTTGTGVTGQVQLKPAR